MEEKGWLTLKGFARMYLEAGRRTRLEEKRAINVRVSKLDDMREEETRELRVFEGDGN